MDIVERAKALTGKDEVSPEQIESTAALGMFPTSARLYGTRYLHWQDILDRNQSRKKALAIWSMVKTARAHHQDFISGLEDVLGQKPSYMITTLLMSVGSLVDRKCTSAALQETLHNYNLNSFFIHSFLDEESIASSQMEGAATTRLVAKKMLQEGRKPRNESENMIIGNHRLMNLAWESRFESMSLELLLEFHRVACLGINDEEYTPGKIRVTDDIYIGGRDGEKVHQPPPADQLDNILEKFIQWINFEHQTISSIILYKSGYNYIHPLIKACIMHFCLGYIHPFRDGNGRVARAICYWQLFRSGYEAFRYISISRLLKEAPIKYGESYLKSETDDMDLTYFIEYQCSIFERAINKTLEYVTQSTAKLQALDAWLFESGLRRKMTETQTTLINLVICMPEKTITIRELSDRLGVSSSTARKNLEGMLLAGILDKKKGGGVNPDSYSVRKQSLDKLKNAIANLLS